MRRATARPYACDSVLGSLRLFFRFLVIVRLRRFCAGYLLAFLGAVAVSPHQHANAIEDLLNDGRSDSGTFFDLTAYHDPAAGPQWSGARFVDDDPCLACFHDDWATEAIALLDVSPSLSVISTSAPTTQASVATDPLRSGQPRAPPSFA